MGQRVVDVQQVEPAARRDLRHLRRERERVGRRDEERIRRRDDLVEVDALAGQVEPRRQRVGDEVDLVASLRQRDPELRRDDAAAAEGRVAGDADLHDGSPSEPGLETLEGRDEIVDARRAARRKPSPNSTPISAPKCRARASIISRKLFCESMVCGSVEAGSWNWLVKARIAARRISIDGVTSTTKVRLVDLERREVHRLLRPVRGVPRLDLAQSGVEGGVRHELAGAAVVGVPVVGVGRQDQPRLLAADDVDDGELLLAVAAQAAVAEVERLAELGAEDLGGALGLRRADLGVPRVPISPRVRSTMPKR